MAVQDIDPFIVMEVMRQSNRLEREGHDVLHMEVGQPGMGAPRTAIKAVSDALEKGELLGYTEALGHLDLRKRIVQHYRSLYGVEITTDHVAVTSGASGAFILAFLAAFKKGDRVALASPGYPAYRNILMALGMEVVVLPCQEDTGFQPTPDILDQVSDIAGLIVASPANPTGTMLSAKDLAALSAYCERRSIRLISDEIYHGLTYGTEVSTARQFSKSSIVINSFSKYFCMTGWRVGWMLLPEELTTVVERLAQNLFICPPAISQLAATASFDATPELEERIATYDMSRRLLLERLPAMGIDRLAPADGAFYIYAFIGHLTSDSLAWCKSLLEEAHVAATPGVDFDQDRGHLWVRFSFAGKTQDIANALNRLESWLQKK